MGNQLLRLFGFKMGGTHACVDLPAKIHSSWNFDIGDVQIAPYLFLTEITHLVGRCMERWGGEKQIYFFGQVYLILIDEFMGISP